ncbi:MAG: hypothetical protein ACQESE_03560 [Nanobdellota archaeon]
MTQKARKLSRAEKERKREQRKQRTMSLILVFLMVGGLAGVATFNMTGNNNEISEIGGYDVTIGQYADFYDRNYQTQVLFLEVDESKKVPLYTYPQVFSQFTMSGNMTELLDNANSIILSGYRDNEMDAQLNDLLRYDISNNIDIPVIGAIAHTTDSSQLPVITCENSTREQPVVILETGNKTTFIRNNTCIEIMFRPEQTHYVRDKVLYAIYGVEV